MASISTKTSGSRRILFGSGKNRQGLYLGKVNQRQAETILGYVENLIAAHTTQTACGDAATNAWVASLGDDYYNKLAALELVPDRAKSKLTLAHLIEQFEASKAVKPSTVAAIKQGTQSLCDYFTPERILLTITPLDAEKWRKDLGEKKIAMATQSKRTQIAKQLFGRAVKWGMIPSNPFEDVRAGSQTNSRRQYFVEREDIFKVIDKCPDIEWKLIIALCRFAGLRCPSEVLALRWSDVHFDTSRLVVTSEKTKHHAGKEQRDVPIVPALLPLLLEAQELAPPGAEFVITRYRRQKVNLRTQFGKILNRAGVNPWPRLFQNLRATCETELAAAGHPLQSIAKWLGHSPAVAAKHYLQVREADYAAASGVAHRSPVEGYEYDAHGGKIATLHPVARRGTHWHQPPQKAQNSPENTGVCNPVPKTTTPCTDVQGDGEWAILGSNQ